MLGSLIIVFREVIEAGIIVGIVMAATRMVPGRGGWMLGGIAAGVLGACLVALFAGAISETFAGSGQELLNATVLSIAVVMLMWHNAWMARHGREIAEQMQQLGAAISAGERPLMALAVVIGAAVLREGSEVVLFLYGIIASGTSGASVFVGGVLGLAAGVAFSALTYWGLLAIPTRHIFTVTTVLVSLLAAGLASQAVNFFYQAGWVNVLGTPLWDTSAWLSQGSIAGRILQTLVGYTEQPTALQLIAYLGTLVIMVALMRVARRTPRRPLHRAAPAE
jgi:high-affinity iron transporter